MKHPSITVIPAHAGIQSRKENISLPPRMPGHDSEKGNALFLILIAVALFAALSYAVTQSGRGNANTDREQAHLDAARVLDYASQVRAAVQRIMLLNNVPIQDVRFNNDVFLRGDGSRVENPMGTPEDPTLYVFHPQGGHVVPQLFEDISIDCPTCLLTSGARPGHSVVRFYNFLKTDTGDVALSVHYLRDDVCEAINAAMGISGIPAVYIPFLNGPYTPGYPPPTGMATPSGAGLPIVAGKWEFCYRNGSRNIFFAVLVPQ